MPVGSIPDHKFEGYTVNGDLYSNLPKEHDGRTFLLIIEVCVDNFMSLVIPVSQSQLMCKT